MQHLMQAARLVLTQPRFWYSAYNRGWPRPIPCPPGTTAPRRNRSSTSSRARPRPKAARTLCRSTERIAIFDNDGTLWSEQPVYFQIAFAFDRIKAMAPQHPEWKTKEPFKSILAGDLQALAETGEKGLAAKSWRPRIPA